ncbi:MAG: enoyl-CoA hydratase-related protein [Myxococcota bacterium]
MSLVTREDHGRVSVLTLTNPPANGYSHAMHRELDAHVVALRMDKGCDVIVIRGAGEKFFCAGADVAYLQSLDPDEKYAFCLHANETLLRLENTPKLVIAAINGHCVGGGLEIALACDLRVGRAGGGMVGLPEVELGVLPGTGGTQRLTRVLGRARALQWMVEGTKVPVEEALAVGLVHKVLPAAGWWEAVLAYAQGFTRPGKAAQAVGLVKRAVHGGADLSLEAGLALERELQMRLFSAPDAREGLAAFLEKRAPRFTGQASPAPHPTPAPHPKEPTPPPPSPTPKPASEPVSTTLPAAPPTREDVEGSTEIGHPATPRSSKQFEGFEDFADFGEDEVGQDAAFGAGGFFGTGRDPAAVKPGEIDLHRTRIPDVVLNLLPRDIVERFLVLPVKRTESTILVAMKDPGNAEARAAIEEETGLTVEAVRAPELDIAVMVARYYRA